MAKLSEKYEAVVVFSLKNGEDAVRLSLLSSLI